MKRLVLRDNEARAESVSAGRRICSSSADWPGTGGEMVRGGAEAHRGSAPTAKGTRELIPGANGGAMKRLVLRDNEARAESASAGRRFAAAQRIGRQKFEKTSPL